MAMSSFTTVFKFSRETLHDIANSIDNPAPRFDSLKRTGKALPRVASGSGTVWSKERLMMDQLTLKLGNADTSSVGFLPHNFRFIAAFIWIAFCSRISLSSRVQSSSRSLKFLS